MSNKKKESKGTSIKKAAILNELNTVNKLRENLVFKQHEPLKGKLLKNIWEGTKNLIIIVFNWV